MAPSVVFMFVKGDNYVFKLQFVLII